MLVNSNPATIMTDPDMAARTYIEPLDADTVARIIETERPDALLPTLGGQTALNVAMELHQRGVLDFWGVEMIGATAEVIHRAEDRGRVPYRGRVSGLRVPRSAIVHTLQEAEQTAAELGLPLVIRPAYTMGGSGGGVAQDKRELRRIVADGLRLSPIGQCCSRNRSSAGTNTSWRSCATRPTTWSSSAPSRTSTPWASTPATASPWRRR